MAILYMHVFSLDCFDWSLAMTDIGKKFPIYIIPSQVKIYATWWEKNGKFLKKAGDLRNYCKEKGCHADSGFTIFEKPESY